MDNLTGKVIEIESAIDPNIDFWVDANKFLNEHLPEDFYLTIAEHLIKRNYNANEQRFFKSQLQEAMGFMATHALFKLMK